jgi:outer membrane protein OmpA-like peptidoglycan-associated protein
MQTKTLLLFSTLVLTACTAKPIATTQISVPTRPIQRVEYSLEARSLSANRNSVYFDSGSAQLKGEGRVIVNKIIDVLRSTPNVQVLLYGYTSQLESSKPLSQARVNAVKRAFLKSKTIDSTRIKEASFGQYDPLAPNKEELDHPQSRRVDIYLMLPSSAHLPQSTDTQDKRQ